MKFLAFKFKFLELGVRLNNFDPLIELASKNFRIDVSVELICGDYFIDRFPLFLTELSNIASEQFMFSGENISDKYVLLLYFVTDFAVLCTVLLTIQQLEHF